MIENANTAIRPIRDKLGSPNLFNIFHSDLAEFSNFLGQLLNGFQESLLNFLWQFGETIDEVISD